MAVPQVPMESLNQLFVELLARRFLLCLRFDLLYDLVMSLIFLKYQGNMNLTSYYYLQERLVEGLKTSTHRTTTAYRESAYLPSKEDSVDV